MSLSTDEVSSVRGIFEVTIEERFVSDKPFYSVSGKVFRKKQQAAISCLSVFRFVEM